MVEFTDDGTYGEEFDAGLTQKDLEGDNDFITLNPSNFRARFDTKLPEIESINLLSSNPGTNPDYNNNESIHYCSVTMTPLVWNLLLQRISTALIFQVIGNQKFTSLRLILS